MKRRRTALQNVKVSTACKVNEHYSK